MVQKPVSLWEKTMMMMVVVVVMAMAMAMAMAKVNMADGSEDGGQQRRIPRVSE
jgi:ABC-type amino acid transport system permease subunit